MSREIPRFEKGQKLRAADLQALANAVAQVLRNSPGFGYGIPLVRYCKLDEDLAAATAANFDASSAPTATVSIWAPNTDGSLEDTGENEEVVNRFGIEYTSATMGLILWADEYIFMGDCAPLS